MFRTIIYNDSEASSYEAIEVSSNTGQTKRFESGDFVKDWFLSTKWIAENITEGEYLTHSSSVDHFIGFDGGNDLYESRYLFTSIVDGAETTILLTREDCDITQLIELFVPKDGTYWSWQRLKDYCYLQDTEYDQSSPPHVVSDNSKYKYRKIINSEFES